ncbi:MAG: hypothetical protein U1F15_12320 [Burkholderiales bacterium]
MKVDARALAMVLALAAAPVLAAPRTIFLLHAYSGRLPVDVQPPLQSSIGTAEALLRVWSQCGIRGEPPKVDFTKRILLLAVRRSSVVKFSGVKLDGGNVTTNVVVTPDNPPYQTCALVVIDRSGVEKVNGAPVGQ